MYSQVGLGETVIVEVQREAVVVVPGVVGTDGGGVVLLVDVLNVVGLDVEHEEVEEVEVVVGLVVGVDVVVVLVVELDEGTLELVLELVVVVEDDTGGT